jgi:hypothetical protein
LVFSSGIIIQHGHPGNTDSLNGTEKINFPISFTSNKISVVTNCSNTHTVCARSGINSTSFIFNWATIDSQTMVSTSRNWISIGY